ncbi:MAG: glycosyltransferase family 4 protein [Byssovorax sp.]
MLPPITFVVDGDLDQPTGGYLYDRIVIDGLRDRGVVVRVESLAVGGVVVTAIENARVALRRAREPREGLVVVDELCHPRTALASLIHRVRPRARLVALVHHLAASERSGPAARARLVVERTLLDAASRVIVTSATTLRAVADAGVDRARIRAVLPGRDRLGERSEPPLPSVDGAVRLLFLGSITPRKGVLALVRAMESLPSHATLTLIGPADRDLAYAAAVRAAVARSPARARIRVTGALPDADVAAALASHDLFVLPSLHEGFGIAVAEALAHGLGVISTTAGAIPEVVRDGREAILVPPGDERALAAALVRVVRDPALREAMASAAIARAAELPRWKDTQREFADALRSAAEP